MRNIASKLVLATVLAAGLAAPALADVDAIASIDKTKTITVTETISIDKDITITITVDRDLARAAEAMALVNNTITFNRVDRIVPGELTGQEIGTANSGPIVRSASIDGEGGSVNGNTGVTGVNQDVGAMANQGNIWSVAFSDDSADSGLFTDAQAEVDQNVSFNNVSYVDAEGQSPGFGNGQVLITADISGSINENVGVTGVNQNAGNMNNQTNAVAAAAGLLDGDDTQVGGSAVALAEAALGQESTFNVAIETTTGGTDKLASITGSIQDNIGITQVNQSVGNFGNQGNVVAVGAAIQGL